MSNDKNNLVYREQLDDNVIEMLSENIGSNYSLRTENTKTIVAALNEILGKDIICNAVGSPLLTTDTFAQMGEKIHVMVNDFKAKLLGLGVSVGSVDKLAIMIEKIGEIDLGVDAEELLNPYIESLREILEREGIEIDENKGLGELIVKVDEIFNEKKLKDETNRQMLIELLRKNGNEINGTESFEELLNMLELIDGVIIRSKDIKQISCCQHTTFILKNDGSVWACGRNNYGQLGLNDTTSRPIFTQVTTNINNDVKQIACGSEHTFILKNDGSVWSCGRNYYGQLGLGEKGGSDADIHTTFTQVTTNINNDVKEVVCGLYHSFILKNDGSIWSCGYNNMGELGLSIDNETYVSKFTQVTTNINNDVKQISCGDNHTFILKNDGSVWSCGNNLTKQLGLEGLLVLNKNVFTQVTTNINNDVKQISCGYNYTYILKNDGSLWACGNNASGQLGLGDETTKTTFTQVTTNINNDVKCVSCGAGFTYMIKNDGSLWACGGNSIGQLGLGNNTNKSTFTQVTTNINNDVKQVICSNDDDDEVCCFTYILKNDGTIWACGDNSYGKLGLNDNIDRNEFTRSYKVISPYIIFK